MPVSSRLSRKLYETFGDEAAHDMVDWMQQVDAQRSEMRQLFDFQFSRFAAFLTEQISGLRQELNGQISGVRQESTGQASSLRHDMEIGFARLETKIEQRSADLIKWSFVFWVGAVGAVALLAGVLK
jgi:hypothetical protein